MLIASLRAIVVIAGSVVAAAAAAATLEYPVKPVRIVTGFPGSMMDVVGRQLALRLGEHWAKSVVVDNRGTNIAPTVTAAAAPDGYTLR